MWCVWFKTVCNQSTGIIIINKSDTTMTDGVLMTDDDDDEG